MARAAAAERPRTGSRAPACGKCGHRGRGYRHEPQGYLEWHEWAERMSRTHHQERCPGCQLYTVWRPGRAEPE